jgi:phage gp45-like
MWDKIMRRLKLILSIGKITLENQDSCTVEFAFGEVSKNVQSAQGYGLEVRPLPGAKAVTIFNAGDRSQGVIIKAVDRRYTQELSPGDTMLYDHRGQWVHLKDTGIDIKAVGDLNVEASDKIKLSDNRGQWVHLKDTGIDIKAVGDLNVDASGNINLNATTINLN